MTGTVRCPTCNKKVPKDSPTLPFCSERCRLLDLGVWLEGEYRIAGEKSGTIEDQADEQRTDRNDSDANE